MILIKIALLVGVQIFVGVGFESLREPDGLFLEEWRVRCSPSHCPVNDMDFNVLVGAEGKHVSIPGDEGI